MRMSETKTAEKCEPLVNARVVQVLSTDTVPVHDSWGFTMSSEAG